MSKATEWLLLLLLSLVVNSSNASASIRKNLKVSSLGLDDFSAVATASADPRPQRFFEVSKPLTVPNFKPCTQRLFRYSFGNTISSPPVSTEYKPRPSCLLSGGGGGNWEKVVLRWRARCKGRQFDRISAVWLSGVEILRTSTAEPTKSGIVWEVEKDVTRFAALFKQPQKLVVSLGNVIDKTYTGIYNVTLHADFYHGNNPGAADAVLPISLPSSDNGGYWFQLQSDEASAQVSLRLPRNIYRATLEVCVSFHGNDEFWYSNPTNDYLAGNNLTSSVPGNGPYREVVALLDDQVVGEILPFPVIFTGGINPLFWRPVAAIGAFNLPSYDLDITPFVGILVSRGSHQFKLRVTNAISFWLLGANLHLWLDPFRNTTSGHLLEYSAPAADVKYQSSFTGLDGVLLSQANRTLSYAGYVASSYGNLTTTASYSYKFSNTNAFSSNGTVNLVEQAAEAKRAFATEVGEQQMSAYTESWSYPLVMYTSQAEGSNHSTLMDANVFHAMRMESEGLEGGKWRMSSLDNTQEASGRIVIQGSMVLSGVGELSQSYDFSSEESCYHRRLKSRNYSLLYDEVGTRCNRSWS